MSQSLVGSAVLALGHILPRLSFIERHLPHIGSLIRSDISAVIAQSELLVVGLNDAGVAAALAEHVRPEQIVLDLARLPDRKKIRGDYRGLCW